MKIVSLIMFMLLSIFGFLSSPTESELITSRDSFSSPFFDFYVSNYNPEATPIFLINYFVGRVRFYEGPLLEYNKSNKLLFYDNFCVNLCIELICCILALSSTY